MIDISVWVTIVDGSGEDTEGLVYGTMIVPQVPEKVSTIVVSTETIDVRLKVYEIVYETKKLTDCEVIVFCEAVSGRWRETVDLLVGVGFREGW